MKNALTGLILLVLIAAAGWYFTQSGSPDHSTNQDSSTSANDSASSSSQPSSPGRQSASTSSSDLQEREGYEDIDERPAAQIYKTAAEAIEAVKKGAQDYDDIVLEQFTEPGEDCSWCSSFYGSITEMMKNPSSSEDEKAYYSEILAISGKVDHIKTLVDSIAEAGSSDDADILAESLEMTIGGDDVVEYLKGHIEDKNELLQESVVAAITNQGSQFAAETLYEHTVKKGDKDGYYSLGIGLAEMIPDEATLPYLQTLMMKRDDYSHLATKALLNQGYDGLVIVFDTLSNSKDPEKDKALLVDAIDHVTFEDEIETYAKKYVESGKDQFLVDFAKEILEDFALEGDDEDDEDDEGL
ncbi:MAG: hypothetical protein KDD55_01105 [Bdellovibrionales bacterium]|nr:hypothetical protein [Bdellovibrionales bacterium]